MLIWLSGYASKGKAEKVVWLAEQLDYVDCFKLDFPFQTEDVGREEDEGYDFFPFVYGKEEFSPYGAFLQKYLPGDRILVISPFIDITTLSWLTSRKKDYNY